jgi:ketosteroid isomerase-like protein
MSQENVESLRQSLDAFVQRDRERWLALCDPDLEIVPVGDWPETDPIRGREAAWDFLVATDEPWEPGPYELVEVIDGGDKIVGHQQRDLRGKTSGVEVKYDYWLVMTVRNGKALRVEWFSDRKTALEAAGLSE